MAIDLMYGNSEVEQKVQEFAASLQTIAVQENLQVNPKDVTNLARMLMANQERCSMTESQGMAFIYAAIKTIAEHPRSLTAIETLQEKMLELFKVK